MVGFESAGGEGDDGGTGEEGLEERRRRSTVVRNTLLDGFADGSTCEDVVEERDIVDREGVHGSWPVLPPVREDGEHVFEHLVVRSSAVRLRFLELDDFRAGFLDSETVSKSAEELPPEAGPGWARLDEVGSWSKTSRGGLDLVLPRQLKNLPNDGPDSSSPPSGDLFVESIQGTEEAERLVDGSDDELARNVEPVEIRISDVEAEGGVVRRRREGSHESLSGEPENLWIRCRVSRSVHGTRRL